MSDSSEGNDKMSATAIHNLRPEVQVTNSTAHSHVTTTIHTGFSSTKFTNDESSLYVIVAGLFSDRISIVGKKTGEMKAQLATYLKPNDIIDEDLLSILADLPI